MNCQARRYNDELICDACGLCWDTYDQDPPECNPKSPPKWPQPQLPMMVFGDDTHLQANTPGLGLARHHGGGYVLVEWPMETIDKTYTGEHRRRYTFFREDGSAIRQVQVEGEWALVKRWVRTPFGKGRLWIDSWSRL